MALLDHQLYLPESWCEDNPAGQLRRAKAHIPETISFQTKPQIAAGLVRRVMVCDSVQLDWITADGLSGRGD
jgi:SRSO17 transposase